MRKYSYVLRTCNPDMTSFNGFTWPSKGMVEAPDWDPTPECGHGLHGFLNGCGIGDLADWRELAQWLVVKVLTKDIVDLGGKVKFPKGEVVYTGDRDGAIAKLEELAPETKHMPVIGAIHSAGAYSEATVGDHGKATAGEYGTAIAGYRGVAQAGESGKAVTGCRGTATTGNFGSSITGAYGTSKAGDWGTAITEERGTAIAGDQGTAQAGIGGKAQAGENGEIRIHWLDGYRLRTAVGYIGEKGLEPNTLYRVDLNDNFVKAL